MEIVSELGSILLDGGIEGWSCSADRVSPEPGVELIHLKLWRRNPVCPAPIQLKWEAPQLDMQCRWYPMGRFNRLVPPNWAGEIDAALTNSAPVVQLSSQSGENRLLFAVSEARRHVKLLCGVLEESNRIACGVTLFCDPEAPLDHYETTLRLDWRHCFYADSIRQTFDWFATFPDCRPAVPPAAAYDAVYSSWYSYHQDLFDRELEAECREAAAFGLKGIIVDDGWQTDDNNRGYAFCGDWEISRRRFPDMRAHVERIHQLGMKYLVWFSVPFVGEKSRNLKRFAGKYLYEIPRLNTRVLDPRFPEVREFLIETYENALRAWDIDGFKLDFIDSFHFEGEDPAVSENYAGRDFKSLPEAVDHLLAETMTRLNELKPGILIEFRQTYIGPAIRKYGNMFRVGDCPADLLSNRVGVVDLRLTSGNTAVHSDMLEWNGQESPQVAAFQLWNVLFAVPQISVRLETIPDSHRRMLRFWMGFWEKNRDLLLHGRLVPLAPMMNYPVVMAERPGQRLIAVYHGGLLVEVPAEQGGMVQIVNASGGGILPLKLALAPLAASACDVFGAPVAVPLPAAGLTEVAVPEAGVLVLRF